MDEQDIAESIIDGNGDNGIDAILLEGESMFCINLNFQIKKRT